MTTDNVTTTLVVNFGDTTGGDTIQAEIDDREKGFNNGKTSFVPGDQPAYLVYPSPNIAEVINTPSMGSIQNLGAGTRSITQEVQFQKSSESKVRFPVSSLSKVEWVGNDLGPLGVVDGSTLRASSSGVAIALVTFNVAYRAFRITNLPLDPLGDGSGYNVLVYIEGKKAVDRGVVI